MTRSNGTTELRVSGVGVSPGIAWGPAELIEKPLEEPDATSISRSAIESEKSRLSLALIATRDQILDLQREIKGNESDDHAGIFDAHLLLLEDATVLNEVIRTVENELKVVDWCYFSVVKRYVDSLRKIADPYLRERAVDIEDVAGRVLKNLRWVDLDSPPSPDQSSNRSIIMAHDLTPSDTIEFDRNRVVGFATEVGSATSHTAIMARSLNLPAVVALHQIPKEITSGDIVLVDGYHGDVIIRPSEETLERYRSLQREETSLRTELESLIEAPTVTLDGHRIILSANIEFTEELPTISHIGADGIGLYRTEFFYIRDLKSREEDHQFANYRAAAEATGEHGVIIRTVDVGGDKLCPDLFEEPEPNPFLGWRGIRLSLDRDAEFRTQIRAILRASAFGKIRVMFPFISVLEELQGAKAIVEEVKSELKDSGIAFDEKIELGAMIEIPSAVMIADHLAAEVDFFSIGTNDLIQYTTAVDRINDRVAHLYQPTHPGVLRLIRETIEAAHRAGIWCGMCGEAAGDLLLTPVWVGLGIDELSVGSSQLLRTRRAISRLDRPSCEEFARSLSTLGSAEEVRKQCTSIAEERYPEILL
ncbi:MAG: phosphoenolpyruvate--protein phosphotransferase [Verrucomicrobiota bacterium]